MALCVVESTNVHRFGYSGSRGMYAAYTYIVIICLFNSPSFPRYFFSVLESFFLSLASSFLFSPFSFDFGYLS